MGGGVGRAIGGGAVCRTTGGAGGMGRAMGGACRIGCGAFI